MTSAEGQHTAEIDAGGLLVRLANDAAAVERICNTLQRNGHPPTDRGTIRRALLAASDECVTPPEVTAQ